MNRNNRSRVEIPLSLMERAGSDAAARDELCTLARLKIAEYAEETTQDPAVLTENTEKRLRKAKVGGRYTLARVVTRYRGGKRLGRKKRRVVDLVKNALAKPDPPAALATYLRILVRSEARDLFRTSMNRLRALERIHRELLREVPENPVTPFDVVELLRKALSDPVVRLRVVESFSEGEIVEILGGDRDSVQGAYRKRIEDLRRQFKKGD